MVAGDSRRTSQVVTLGTPFACTSPLPLRWLLPAQWSLSVVGTDGAGNAAAAQRADWTVAFPATPGALYTRFTDGPYGRQPKTELTYSFVTLSAAGEAAAAPSGSECWLERAGAGANASYAPCTTSHTLPADLQVRYATPRRCVGLRVCAGACAPLPLPISTWRITSRDSRNRI